MAKSRDSSTGRKLSVLIDLVERSAYVVVVSLGLFTCLVTDCHAANRFVTPATFDTLSTRRPSSRGHDLAAVVEPPLKSIFRPTSQNLTVSPGDRAVLKCKVENLGTKTITWRKREDVHPLTIGMFNFAPDTRITVDYNQRTTEWTLTIQDVRPTDEGVYCCQISTKHDRDTYDIRLNVRTIQVSGTDFVDVGGEIQLTCNATGRPEPPHNVDWYKDGSKIISDAHNGVIITKKIETKILVSMLLIKRSRSSDGGKYECQSSENESGSFIVRILSAASPPAEKSAIGGGEKAFGRYSRGHAVTSHQYGVITFCLCLLPVVLQLTEATVPVLIVR